MAEDYADAELTRVLAEDPEIAELGVEVVAQGDSIVLRGHVESEQRREAVERRAREHLVHRRLVNEIAVLPTDPPVRAEQLP